MRFSKQQLATIQSALDQKEMEPLAQHVLDHHPEYADSLGEEGLLNLIRNIMSFGYSFGIISRQSRKRLLSLQSNRRFLEASALSEASIEALSFPGRPEELKVDYFHKQLIFESEQP